MSSNAFIRCAMLTLMTLLAALPGVAARNSELSMEILVDGRPLDELYAHGSTYVEALSGREYSIRLTNHSRRRVAVALAVDGLNSINAKTTTARNAAKWILAPNQSVTIDGWQTSTDNARRFFFTTEPESYGAWLGETANLGVIEAALFHELPPPTPVVGWTTREGRAGESSAPSTRSQSSEKRRSREVESHADGEALSDEMAATGIGDEVDHPVRWVSFDCDTTPSAQLRIRYEYRPQLVELGVLPRPGRRGPLPRREHASGFTDSDFAPDPYRGR